jgi:hypothetical protein
LPMGIFAGCCAVSILLAACTSALTDQILVLPIKNIFVSFSFFFGVSEPILGLLRLLAHRAKRMRDVPLNFITKDGSLC